MYEQRSCRRWAVNSHRYHFRSWDRGRVSTSICRRSVNESLQTTRFFFSSSGIPISCQIQIYSFTRKIDWASRESQRAFLHVRVRKFRFQRTVICYTLVIRRCWWHRWDWQSASRVICFATKDLSFHRQYRISWIRRRIIVETSRSGHLKSHRDRSRDRHDGKTYFWDLYV